MIDITRRHRTDPNAAPVRIGAVSYLNSKPLIEGLPDLASGARLVLDYPSRLADGLSRGELDVALVPSIECFMDPEYEVVSDACVATRGPVLSVKLYSRVHPGLIRTLALDEGSRTSAALVRIMLDARFGVVPKVTRLPMERSVRDTRADAVLLIGDRAIQPPTEVFDTVWDLGEEWLNWTGLPFVFAMWVTRARTDLGPTEAALSAARNLGLARLPEIAAREAPALGLTTETALNYLSQNLHFRLGSAERSGLKLFRRLAANLGLVPSSGDIRFRGPSAGSTFRELTATHCPLPATH